MHRFWCVPTGQSAVDTGLQSLQYLLEEVDTEINRLGEKMEKTNA